MVVGSPLNNTAIVPIVVFLESSTDVCFGNKNHAIHYLQMSWQQQQ